MTLASSEALVGGRQLTRRDPAAQEDDTFRALGDQLRRQIVDRLSEGELTMSELAAAVGLSLPALHHHLTILERGGVVYCEKRGRVRWCRLDFQGLDRAEQWLIERRRAWMRRLDMLESAVAKGVTSPQEERPVVPIVRQISFRQCGAGTARTRFPGWRMRRMAPGHEVKAS